MNAHRRKDEPARSRTLASVKSLRSRARVNRFVRRTIKAADRAVGGAKRHWPVSGEVIVQLEDVPLRLWAAPDDDLVTDLYYGTPWEKAELRAWLALLPNRGVILDIGAYSGVYALLAAQRRPSVKIFAFEPNPLCAARLRKNIALNAIQNVEVIEKAVSAASGAAPFSIPVLGRGSDASSLNRAFSEAHYAVEYTQHDVETVSVDDFVAARPTTEVRMIKIDVESHELSAIRGGESVLLRDRPVVFCEIMDPEIYSGLWEGLDAGDFSHSAEEVEQFIGRVGYYIYSVGDHGLVRVAGVRGNPLGMANYVLSPYKAKRRLIPWSDEAALDTLRGAGQLMSSP